MVKSSKILTVSYGTFSCTLEGFDDAFGTMKAIAEYFRDLAADDRYFGAEPPTPDAELLARIAEREISRQVDARDTGDGIVLRPSLAAASAGVTAAAEVAETGPDDDAAGDDDTTLDIQSDDAADTVDAPVEETPARFEMSDETAEVQAEPFVETDEAAADASEAEAEPMPEPVPEVSAEGLLSDAPDVDAVEPLDQADMESVAAKLKRIRDVVARSPEAPAAPAPDFSEDEHAEDFLAATARDIEAALDEPAEESHALEAVRGEEAALPETAAEEPAATEPEAAEEAEAELTAPEGQTTDHEPSETEAPDAPSRDTEAEYEEDQEPAAEDTGDDGALRAMFDAAAEDEADEAKPVRAQVIKMKRADLEAAIADRELEKAAQAEAQEAEEGPAQEEESSLSDEDEAELQRELAAVSAELDDTEEPAPEAPQQTGEDRKAAEDEDDFDLFGEDEDEDDEQPESILADDRDVDRLMTEADSQLDQPEAKGRRAAIAHLRAAVAAAKEERKVGSSLTDDSDQTEDYKDDLASVVRPRRPMSRPARTERPSDAAAGPLKLVAAQRVDIEQPAPASEGIVRPRRVSSRVLHEQEAAAEAAAALEAGAPVGDDGFAAYADQMGAAALPELLEAAASYLSFVEGRDQFSRPQLMTRARDTYRGEFSREDGLRYFGQLLREGKIEKIKGGRFTVSDQIGYQPKARAAG